MPQFAGLVGRTPAWLAFKPLLPPLLSLLFLPPPLFLLLCVLMLLLLLLLLLLLSPLTVARFLNLCPISLTTLRGRGSYGLIGVRGGSQPCL